MNQRKVYYLSDRTGASLIVERESLLLMYVYINEARGYRIGRFAETAEAFAHIWLPGADERGGPGEEIPEDFEIDTSDCTQFSGEAITIHWIASHVKPEHRWRLKFAGLHLHFDEREPDLEDIQSELNCEP